MEHHADVHGDRHLTFRVAHRHREGTQAQLQFLLDPGIPLFAHLFDYGAQMRQFGHGVGGVAHGATVLQPGAEHG